MPLLTAYLLTYRARRAAAPSSYPYPTPTTNSDAIPRPIPSLNPIVSRSPIPEQARSGPLLELLSDGLRLGHAPSSVSKY